MSAFIGTSLKKILLPSKVQVIKVPKSKKKKYTKMLRKSGLSKKIKIKSLC